MTDRENSQSRRDIEAPRQPKLVFLRPKARNTTTWLFAVLGFLFILTVFKVLPGHAPSAQYVMSDATYAECMYKARSLDIEGCRNFGFPRGSPKTFGLPVSALGSYLGEDGTVAISSILAVYAGFLLIAYVSAILLFKRIAGTTRLAILGAILYLGSVSIHKYMEYGALGLGIALIPCYLLIDLHFLDSLSSASRVRKAAWFIASVAARTFAIFLDGYSFLFSAGLAAACLTLSPLIHKNLRLSTHAFFLYVLACGIAAMAYKGYFPSDALGSTNLNGFRAQGVDTYGLISPQPDSMYSRWFGIGTKIDPLITYSDGSSSHGLFLGYAWLLALLALAALFSTTRRLLKKQHVAPILLVGFVSLLLSLGPSLKFKSFRDVPAESITSSHYQMPESAALMPLPTAWIYQNIPGIKTARALVRWLSLTRLAITLLIVLAIIALIENKRFFLALGITTLALLEILPDFKTYMDSGKFAYARAYTLYYDYPASLRPYVKAGERALFLELHPRPGGNQYSVNTLCTRASLFCYNTGGDKASVLVQRHWPIDVLDARNLRHTDIAVKRIFESKLADVVIIPYFDLKLSAYSESQGSVDIAGVLQSAEALALATGTVLTPGERYAFLRAGAKPKSTDAGEDCSISCWRSWPDIAGQAPKWGPKKAAQSRPLNLQPDGRSLIWVQIPDPGKKYALALGDTILATQSNKKVVSGSIPRHLSDSFVPGSRYPLYLLDTENSRKQLIGDLNIAGLGE